MNMKHAQSGAALFTALVFLIIITMLSLSAMRSSMLELRMASNQELKNTAFQRAQAVVDATVGDTNNMPTIAVVGKTSCMTSDPNTDSECDTWNVDLRDNYLGGYSDFFDGDTDNGEVISRVTRLAPLEKPAPRAVGMSAEVFSVATYEIDARYDLSEIGQGSARIREGLMLLISN